MDKEIEALDIQLEKYKKLKIGMMSKLLTGEIRLAE
jgi:type I restriction enzyme S subunit